MESRKGTLVPDNTRAILKETSHTHTHAHSNSCTCTHTPPPLDAPLGCNWEQGGPQQINKTYWFSVIWLSRCHNDIIGKDQCVCVCTGTCYSEWWHIIQLCQGNLADWKVIWKRASKIERPKEKEKEREQSASVERQSVCGIDEEAAVWKEK